MLPLRGQTNGNTQLVSPAPRATAAGVVRGLALSCHPGPTVAVTALTTALAAGSGTTLRATVAVALAVLAGQLSIGWSNDWIDAARDRTVARPDKPVAIGLVTETQVRHAAVGALIAAGVLSAALGWRVAVVHLLAVVGSGWAYNLRLKGTWWSWAPYVLCFGMLPSVATLALPGHPFAPGWATGAGALLGLGAHLANVLPDLDDDATTGVRGFPHRLGRTRTVLLAPVALLAATVCVVLGPRGAPAVVGWMGLGLAAALAGTAAAVALKTPRSRLPFRLTIGVAVVDVALLITVGAQLS